MSDHIKLLSEDQQERYNDAVAWCDAYAKEDLEALADALAENARLKAVDSLLRNERSTAVRLFGKEEEKAIQLQAENAQLRSYLDDYDDVSFDLHKAEFERDALQSRLDEARYFIEAAENAAHHDSLFAKQARKWLAQPAAPTPAQEDGV